MEQQQEGRIVRLGCHTYTISPTIDQEVAEEKKKFLAQLLTRKLPEHSERTASETVLSPEKIRAAALGLIQQTPPPDTSCEFEP